METGALNMSGWSELGLDPRLVVTVRAPDADAALRTAADALACDALGTVVLEVWGEARQLDLVASRRLTLASRASGVTGLLLRMAAVPSPSTAETRWIVRSAHSPPALPWQAWGVPALDAQLVATGSWNGSVMSAFSVKRRILSLWLPRLPTDRLQRLRACSGAPANNLPCIVVARHSNALQISALDDAAATLGLEVGLPLANARAICPDIEVADADPAADAELLNHVADWCDRFTPLVALDRPHGLFLDITESVFGQLHKELRSWTNTSFRRSY
eukprot:gene11359-15194_t